MEVNILSILLHCLQNNGQVLVSFSVASKLATRENHIPSKIDSASFFISKVTE